MNKLREANDDDRVLDNRKVGSAIIIICSFFFLFVDVDEWLINEWD